MKMNRGSIRAAVITTTLIVAGINPLATHAQAVPGAAGAGSTGATGSNATGVNSATTQAPTSTFQLQDFSRNSQLNAGTQIQPLSQPSGLLQNHAPMIQPGSYGVPTTTDLSRQSLTPNMYSTPNPVMPSQANRSVMTSPRPVMPSYQKSPALQQLQPQLLNH